MTDNAIIPGCVLHWEGFKLADGTEGHKFFVIVGAKPGCNYLAIRATSKKKSDRTYAQGGNHIAGYYHIPGGGRDFFPLDTWLLFAEPEEFSPAEFLQEVLIKRLEVKGHLRPDMANAICNCMRKCEDVSAYHQSLLGPPQTSQKN